VAFQMPLMKLNNDKELLIKTETKFEKHFRFGINILTNLEDIFSKAPIEIKQKIIGLFFPEKLEYENGNYRTTKINQVLELFPRLPRVLKGDNIERADISAGSSTWAPLNAQSCNTRNAVK
jgi:hypothetical protein